MNEKTEQIKALFADQAFVAELLDAENEEAVQKKLADKGVEMSLTEIEIMGEMMCALADGKVTEEQLNKLANGGELSEDELAEAAGGNWFTNLFTTTTKVEVPLGTIDHFDYVYKTPMPVASVPKIAAGVVGGVIVAAGAAYGICKACGVDVEGGLSTAYNWCKEKITSRW